MAFVRGPLMSVEAHGTFAETLTFQQRHGKCVVYLYKPPTIPNTASQQAQRASVASAVSSWNGLPAGSKVWWQGQALGMALSGYNLYIKNYLLGLL